MNNFYDFFVNLLFPTIVNHFLNLLIILFVHFLFFLFAKYLVFKVIYRYDDSRRYASINVMILLNIVSFLSWCVAELIQDYEHFRVVAIFSVIYLSKFVFHILSYLNLKIYGKHKDFKQEVTNSIKKRKLKNIFKEKISSSKVDKVDLNPEFFFIKNEEKFYRNISTNVSSKTSNLIDILLLLFVIFVAFSLIIPLIGDLSSFLNNTYLLALFAFIFVYVLAPLYPNLYGSFLIIKNDAMDIGDIIWIQEKDLKGRIVEVTMFWVKLKDHNNNLIITVPSAFFNTYSVINLSRYNSIGKKEVLEYIFETEIYVKDLGEELKIIVKQALDKLENDLNGFSKGNSYNVWITPDDNGITLTVWYYISDLEKQEKIILDVDDYLFTHCVKSGFIPKTQEFLEISKK